MTVLRMQYPKIFHVFILTMVGSQAVAEWTLTMDVLSKPEVCNDTCDCNRLPEIDCFQPNRLSALPDLGIYNADVTKL